jgi:2-polyprenyl-6-methoxyphenol hydroxylase-like FAD-dependent oxidoreductase
MENPNILIVGAGPSGLAIATDLYRRGIGCRIIEAKTDRNRLSKAMALHAGTLSLLFATLGEDLVNNLISRGKIVSRINFHLEKRLLSQLNLSSLPGDFRFVLLIEQSCLEEVFENELIRLGGRVERGVMLHEIKKKFNCLEAKINDSEFSIYDYPRNFLQCNSRYNKLS